MSKGAFRLNASSLSVGFQRFERDGLIRNEWKATENSRRAKYYALTDEGRKRLNSETRDWGSEVAAIARILEASGLALILACDGLYGLLSHEVARRAREIGIRTALGAQGREILRLLLIQGLILAMVGALVGMGAAIGVTRYLGSLLYGIGATDPATFVIIAFLLIAVALLASYIPARRATRFDPMVALRYE